MSTSKTEKSAKSSAAGAVHGVSEEYDRVRDRASDSYRQSQQDAFELEQRLEAFIHRQPLLAMLAAVGIGMTLERIWKRLR